MTSAEFIELLNAEGYREIVTVERTQHGELPEHAHVFTARALILEGEIMLDIGGASRSYRAGQVFELDRGQLHTERYGPQGVRYLVGRK